MAKLSDKEKAKAILGDVVEPEKADEPSTEPAPETNTEGEPEVVEPEEAESEEEKPTEEEDESDKPTDSTFTKQFPNLKGETPEEYLPELETAYDNSFKEALRLNEDNKRLRDENAQLKTGQPVQAVVAPAVPATPETPQSSPAYEDPALSYAKTLQTKDMIDTFDTFKKQYPQVLDQADFDRFTKASDGVSVALTSALGRQPTYAELFPAIAGSLGWQATNPAKDAAIKDNASSTRTPGSQSPARPKPAKVSDASVDAYLKMFTSKTREEAIKELSEVV